MGNVLYVFLLYIFSISMSLFIHLILNKFMEGRISLIMHGYGGSNDSKASLPLELILLASFSILEIIFFLFPATKENSIFSYILFLNILPILICFYVFILNKKPPMLRITSELSDEMENQYYETERNKKQKKQSEITLKRLFEIRSRSYINSTRLLLYRCFKYDKKNVLLSNIEDYINKNRSEMVDLKSSMKPMSSALKRYYFSHFMFLLFSTIMFASMSVNHGVKSGVLTINGLDVGSTFIDCVYYIISTISTLGYGDMYPTNQWSKVMVILLVFWFLILINILLNILGEATETKIEDGFRGHLNYYKLIIQDFEKFKRLVQYDDFISSKHKGFIDRFFNSLDDYNYIELIQAYKKNNPIYRKPHKRHCVSSISTRPHL